MPTNVALMLNDMLSIKASKDVRRKLRMGEKMDTSELGFHFTPLVMVAASYGDTRQ